MKKYQNDCVGCPPEMGCRGAGCPYQNVPHWYCDDCGDEYSPFELRVFEGDMLCRGCFTERAWEDADAVETVSI